MTCECGGGGGGGREGGGEGGGGEKGGRGGGGEGGVAALLVLFSGAIVGTLYMTLYIEQIHGIVQCL